MYCEYHWRIQEFGMQEADFPSTFLPYPLLPVASPFPLPVPLVVGPLNLARAWGSAVALQ